MPTLSIPEGGLHGSGPRPWDSAGMPTGLPPPA
jgi:hypothetical protein